jgi:Colicin D
VSTAAPRTMTFVARQLQRKFKHAVDFGVMGPYSRAQATRFEQAIRTSRMRRPSRSWARIGVSRSRTL